MTNPPARRTVLGTGAAAALLMGCSKSGDNSSSSASSPTGTMSPNTNTTASASPSGGQELARTSDIPLGGGKIFKDRKIVVTQPQKD